LHQDIDEVKEALATMNMEQEELIGEFEDIKEDENGAKLEEWADKSCWKLDYNVKDPNDDDI
jgi:hypothetical protein